MKHIITVITVSLLILCISAGAAYAGGYQLNLLGQRQIGMGHVGVGMPLDVAAISMNPGGLASLDHNGAMVGINGTFINTTFNSSLMPGYEAETDSDIRTPFNIYAAYDTPAEGLKAGIGVYTPYGNSVRWGEDWMYAGMLSEISMSVIFVQPTLSYQLTDRLGIGAGFIYAIGSVNLQRQAEVDLTQVNPGLPDNAPLSVELDGSTTAIGFNAGIHYQHNEIFSLGVSYRSEVEMNLEDGDADFSLGGGVPAEVSNQLFPPGNTFDATLPLPAVLSIGLGLKPTVDLRIGIDANLTFWDTYENLAFDFDVNTPALQDSDEPREFNNRWIFRIGGEYDVTDALQVRLGTYYDPSPVDEGFITPETPDVDRFGFSAGIGYEFTPAFGMNASLLYITSSAREQSMEDAAQPGTPDIVPIGEFQTNAFIPGISLYHRF